MLNSALLNKGAAFTAEERKALGLTGLLPADISTLGTQLKRPYIQHERLADALSKNIYFDRPTRPQRGVVLPAIFRAPA